MASFFISPTGNDVTGNGSQSNPWATISKGVSGSSAGDTINCLTGTFTWVGQSFSSNRTIVGAGAGNTIFDGANANVSWNNSATLTISGITFQNAFSVAGLPVFRLDLAGAAFNFTTCIFSNIDGTTGGGSGWGPFDTNNTLGGSDNTFYNLVACVIANSAGLGNDGVFNANSGILNVTLTNVTIYSNIAAGSTIFIIQSVGLTVNARFTNCIIYNANGTSKAFDAGGGAITYAGSNNNILGYTSPPSLPSQLSVNPLFTNVVVLNFNLTPTSPCIGKGIVT